ncbi:hypothetical protein L218DRAFT_1008477 [Marasmius fiardii PR-910]|nr:hypothetical protein L218DRAFT_1008477 [Marasmius fiardii PR-910]
MFSAKYLTLFIVSMMMTSTAVVAGPAPVTEVLVAKDQCNDEIGRCDENGCAGAFPKPDDIRGTCTQGQFKDCPCNKCGDINGSCSDNGCFGVNNICTRGTFQGCPCN